ncbi:MAG: methionine gamma-lyase family protein [Defluviitaleaceae bacterium]|nr:methionine gamma-lyase family protein [Defluviitaleaceae bacterium]MCL2275483.1 methionine gamma-lyase family protein [Defluviitaleaceae bacterium]
MLYHRLIQNGTAPIVASYAEKTEQDPAIARVYAQANEIADANQLKVLHAMQKCRLSDGHFVDSTGYGYHDIGRQALEDIYAEIFCAEAALVRPQLISGTHALAVALFGNLRPHDMLYSPVGAPYDTLERVIGIRPAEGSLAEYGITYKQTDLTEVGEIDLPAVRHVLGAFPQIKMVTIQRSKGYAWRPSFTIANIENLIAEIREIRPDVCIMVDNCYGEFVEDREPIEAGADIIAGSLIKNPGGGIAAGGGYVAGKRKYVELAATRLTAPGIGGDVGPTLGMTRSLLQGLFIAPQTVSGCIQGAVLTSAVFEKLGFPVNPTPAAKRTDIVQAIRLGDAKKVLAFCRGIQSAAPVDSYVTPEAAPMPGYTDGVVMAGGTFVQGSSIELSADAPMRAPYNVFFQGGLTAAHARAGAIYALDALYKEGMVQL